ncbi:hypothetical protein NDU88_000800 [Pleurodeles waltl]|uniref:Uncharacterized protein n=1 Tax=Pleurodeles waltl TaxID=8319 RepID=A0AAV7P217_PLEWA|nr:hypothetical protein NDU88_000800 [Pleurodeles waltl]
MYPQFQTFGTAKKSSFYRHLKSRTTKTHPAWSRGTLFLPRSSGTEPRAADALRSSLLLLQRDYSYRRVLLCGRILGLCRDYFIARGEEEPGPEEEPEQLWGLKTLYR